MYGGFPPPIRVNSTYQANDDTLIRKIQLVRREMYLELQDSWKVFH